MAKTWTKLISEKAWSWIIILKLRLLDIRNTRAFIHACTHASAHTSMHKSTRMRICKHANARTQMQIYICNASTCMHTVQAHTVQACKYMHIHTSIANTCTQACKNPNTHTSMKYTCTHHRHTLTHLLYFSSQNLSLTSIVFIKIVLLIFTLL